MLTLVTMKQIPIKNWWQVNEFQWYTFPDRLTNSIQAPRKLLSKKRARGRIAFDPSLYSQTKKAANSATDYRPTDESLGRQLSEWNGH